jgi:hypothetical protein
VHPIPFYTFGAIFLEYLLRLGALCIGFWFIDVLILRRCFRMPVFWLLNLIIALYEIWPYLAQDIHAGHWGSVARLPAEPLYLSNVFEGWLLLRYGWFTPIVFRLAFYLFWHILFGGFAAPYFGQWLVATDSLQDKKIDIFFPVHGKGDYVGAQSETNVK